MNYLIYLTGTIMNHAHVQPTGEYHYHGMPCKELTIVQEKDLGSKRLMKCFFVNQIMLHLRLEFKLLKENSKK